METEFEKILRAENEILKMKLSYKEAEVKDLLECIRFMKHYLNKLNNKIPLESGYADNPTAQEPAVMV